MFQTPFLFVLDLQTVELDRPLALCWTCDCMLVLNVVVVVRQVRVCSFSLLAWESLGFSCFMLRVKCLLEMRSLEQRVC